MPWKSSSPKLSPARSWAHIVAAATLGLTILLFVLSLILPAYRLAHDDPVKSDPAIILLLVGWMGLAYGTYAWLANPLLLLSCTFMATRWTRPIAISTGLLALGTALCFQRQTTIIRDEAGNYDTIVSYGPAYFVWITSMATLVLGAVLASLLDFLGRKRQPSP